MRTVSRIAAGISIIAFSAGSAWAQVEPAPDETAEEIIVSGLRASLQRAIDIEREAPSVVSVITADDIGQFADQNVAESLQRVPGITIDRDEGEGRNIRVRGLSSDFNQVTINGAQIGSSDQSGGRSVTLDVISSELLAGIVVAKALTPDFDHDSLGALVDLRTLSAFDRPGPTLNFRVEGSYGERVAKVSPKVSANGTVRLLDDRLGLAFAVNYFDRDIQLSNLRNDAGPAFQRILRSSTGALSFTSNSTVPAGSTLFLRPNEADQRIELGTRERLGGTFGLEFRTDEENRFAFNVIAARLNDNDIRVQQETEFRRSDTPARIITIGPNEATLARVDVERQITFQDRVDQVLALNLEGENRFSERLRFKYAADYSYNRFELPGALRGRFRERLVPASYVASRDSVDITYLTPPAGVDATNPFRYAYDNILTYDEYRTDEILSYGADLIYDFNLFGGDSFFQFGVKNRHRDKSIRRGEVSRDFETAAQIATLGGQIPLRLDQLPLFTPRRTNFTNFTFFPELGAAREQFQRTVDLLGLDTSTSPIRVDYDAREDVLAGYGMVSLAPSPEFSAILGVRVERTKYAASGTITTRTERDGALISGGSITGPAGGREYTEWLPSVHLRWEPSPQFVARAVFSRQQVRPAFDDVRGNQEISVEESTINGQVRTVSRILEGGNPQLKPLIANAVDMTLGWYPSRDFSVTAAAFYKDLKSPFVTAVFSGNDVALTGNAVFDPATGAGFTEVEAAGNAGAGRLLGVEIGFSYFARSLPSPLNGLFASGNVTLIDGEIQSTFIRNNAKLSLNNQPSKIANLSLGYEDETFSLRWSANYVGRSLQSINTSDPFLDRFNAPFFSMDVNARLKLFKWLQLYADAININEAEDQRYWRGNGQGGFYERIDDYGRTFQFGATVGIEF